MRHRPKAQPYDQHSLQLIMDRRVKPGDDARDVAGAVPSGAPQLPATSQLNAAL
jgi:hypothetical protein